MQSYKEKIDGLMDKNPYSLNKKDKENFLTSYLKDLSIFHYENCFEYKKIINSLDLKIDKIKSYYDLPFLPVRLFKDYELKSIDNSEVIKTLTSSGTTGQKVSKIFLDRDTSSYQQKVLVKLVSSFLGNKRLPMIILDTSAILKNRNMFSARGAGILGFSIFGSEKIYALDENMNLNMSLIKEFLEKHKGENIFMFGFTYMIWQHFYKELLKSDEKIDLSKSILIHGGGWKKLINESVDSKEFKSRLNNVCGINVNNIHDYYGMVEQTGTIYMECEEGFLHCSNFSDVIIRSERDFSICDFNKKGIIQVVSSLPKSYPGHSLLTEDEGILFGEDDCKCGRCGKYFKVLGRIANAEIRGCSDTYAFDKFK